MFRLRFTGLVILFVIPFQFSFAKDFPVQARFFAGSKSVDPQNANTTIQGQGLQTINSVTQLGFEATYPLLKYLNVGMRYTKIIASKDEQPSDPSTDFYSQIDQDAVLLLARVPFFKSEFVWMDAFAGVGGSNTTFKLKSATQDGELTRRASGDWFASPVTAAGLAIGIGYKQFAFVIEGGIETNKVDGFTRSGSISSSLDTLDLSGSYVSVGLSFDGLSASTK